MRSLSCLALLLTLSPPVVHAGDKKADPLWVVYEGKEGPGKGKHIVLVSGDEEYRSEEALPQLGKILATQHGFKCTVLFAIDPKTGEIDPNINDNIPGLENLKSADLMIIATRFRNLPDEQMEHIAAYVDSGKPIIGLRTATHAFNLNKKSKFLKYTWNLDNKQWPGGFGKQILGDTWLSHHGNHGKESTRGIIAPDKDKHSIVRGIKDGDIWGPTDVYGVRLPLPKDSEVLVLGQVLVGMKPTDEPVKKEILKKKVKDEIKEYERTPNDPMMPLAWTRLFETAGKSAQRVFTTTMGSSTDLESAGLRRLLVNAVYWTLAMERRIPEGGASVDIVGEYRPRPFAFKGFQKGVRPADLVLK